MSSASNIKGTLSTIKAKKSSPRSAGIVSELYAHARRAVERANVGEAIVAYRRGKPVFATLAELEAEMLKMPVGQVEEIVYGVTVLRASPKEWTVVKLGKSMPAAFMARSLVRK